MDKLLIEWGKLDRTEAIEQEVLKRATKIIRINPRTTKLIVTFQIINPKSSKGPSKQKVSMELRMPNKQDIRASAEGENTYHLIADCEKALIRMSKSSRNFTRPEPVTKLSFADQEAVS